MRTIIDKLQQMRNVVAERMGNMHVQTKGDPTKSLFPDEIAVTNTKTGQRWSVVFAGDGNWTDPYEYASIYAFLKDEKGKLLERKSVVDCDYSTFHKTDYISFKKTNYRTIWNMVDAEFKKHQEKFWQNYEKQETNKNKNFNNKTSNKDETTYSK